MIDLHENYSGTNPSGMTSIYSIRSINQLMCLNIRLELDANSTKLDKGSWNKKTLNFTFPEYVHSANELKASPSLL